MTIINRNTSDSEFRNWVAEQLDMDNKADNEITINRMFYKAARIVKQLPEEEKEKYKKYFIETLLDYGNRSKGEWIDDGNPAKQHFMEAISIQKILPIAYYRLGHIFYKQGDLGGAVYYFSTALDQMKEKHNQKYTLEDYQLSNAEKLLAFCCLQVFEVHKLQALISPDYPEANYQIQKYLDRECREINTPQIALWEYSNENGIEKKLISKSDYDELIDQLGTNSKSMYIDAYNPQICIGYLGNEQQISIDNYLLLISILKNDQQTWKENEFPVGNRFNQRLSRLRNYLNRINITEKELEITKDRGQEIPKIRSSLDIYIFRHIEE